MSISPRADVSAPPSIGRAVTRILYVHHGKGIGGAPLSLLYLIRALDRQRFAPTVLCLHESDATELFRREGVETVVDERWHDFSHTNVLWYPWWQLPKILLRALQFPWTYVLARSFFRRRRFDIVHLNTSTLTAVGLAARAEGLRVVWHVREPLHAGYVGLRRALIRRIIHRVADAVVPICRYDASQLIPSERIHVVYNFVDRSVFDPRIDARATREELGLASGQCAVLMLGGINPVKGTAEFVAAAAALLRERDDLRFFIAGAIPDDSFRNRMNGLRVYRDIVFSRIAPEHRQHIRFLGVRSDIPQLLAASDMLCFPSTVPHFARPVIEASAMGRPVIASRLGGPEELVLDGETGVLLPAGDVAALAEAIAALADSTERRQAMGAAGIALAARQFDAEANARSVVALYDALRDSATEA